MDHEITLIDIYTHVPQSMLSPDTVLVPSWPMFEIS